MLTETEASGTHSFPFRKHNGCIVYKAWLVFLFSLQRICTHGIFIPSFFFFFFMSVSFTFVFLFPGHPVHAQPDFSWQPMTFGCCQLHLPALSLPTLPPAQLDNQRRHFLSNSEEQMYYFHGMPRLFWPTACKLSTHALSSRLRRGFNVRLIVVLHCRRWTQRIGILLLLLLEGFQKVCFC